VPHAWKTFKVCECVCVCAESVRAGILCKREQFSREDGKQKRGKEPDRKPVEDTAEKGEQANKARRLCMYFNQKKKPQAQRDTRAQNHLGCFSLNVTMMDRGDDDATAAAGNEDGWKCCRPLLVSSWRPCSPLFPEIRNTSTTPFCAECRDHLPTVKMQSKAPNTQMQKSQ